MEKVKVKCKCTCGCEDSETKSERKTRRALEIANLTAFKDELMALTKKYDVCMIGNFKLGEHGGTALVGEMDTADMAMMMDAMETAVKGTIAKMLAKELGIDPDGMLYKKMMKEFEKEERMGL